MKYRILIADDETDISELIIHNPQRIVHESSPTDTAADTLLLALPYPHPLIPNAPYSPLLDPD